MLLAVPSLLIVAPLVGFFVGKYADRWLKTAPWLSAAGLVLGFIAAGREVYLILRRVNSE